MNTKILHLPFFRFLSYAVLAATMTVFAWETWLYVRYRAVIQVDGRELVVHARAQTVGKVLVANKIILGPKDIVEPKTSDPVPPRGTIRIIRVTEKIIKTDDSEPMRILWTKRMDQNLRPVELQKCLLRRVYREIRVVYHDGKEAARETVKEHQVKKTVYRLALLGEGGYIKKVFDLSRARKINMVATAYYPGDPLAWRDGTVTCLGLKMRRGIVAVDPKVIPLRSRVYVSGYGYGYAGDTGSAIKGRRIDLGVSNVREEDAWMHRPVTVYVLDKAQEW